MDLPGVAPESPACDAGVFLLDDKPILSERKPRDSNSQATFAATCFQDKFLIQPDDFRPKLRELESNQRPPGSEPGVTTNSNYPASVLVNDTHNVMRFA